MRHRRKTTKLQRTVAHRDSLLRNLACSLIEHRRIRTTLAKAKALRPYAEKLVTLGKTGTLHARRTCIALLGSSQLARRCAKTIFEEIAPASAERQGGYCRITKLVARRSDSAPMAFIEWVDSYTPAVEAEEAEEAAKS